MPRKKKRAKVVPQNGAAQAAENIAAAAAKLEASGKAPAVAGTVIENALLEGCPGCHFVDMDTEWVVRVRRTTAADAADRDPEQSKECQVQMIPQGDDCALLSVANFTSSKRAAYVSAVAGEADAILALSGKAGAPLAVGETAMEPEHPVPCATFVARLAPKTLIEMAEVKSECVGVSSLSFELLPHPDPTPESAAARFHQFPLGGSGPFLCTQGVGGRLTHFFPESYHAFDLRCPVGTPLLAIADGEIVEVMHDTRCTGIHCDNLTEWNSIALRVDDIVVEYLHLAPEVRGRFVLYSSCHSAVSDIRCCNTKLCRARKWRWAAALRRETCCVSPVRQDSLQNHTCTSRHTDSTTDKARAFWLSW